MTITVIIVVITFLVSLHPLKISCFYLYVFVSLSAGLLEKSLTNFDKKNFEGCVTSNRLHFGVDPDQVHVQKYSDGIFTIVG